jgi:hypothetical protein
LSLVSTALPQLSIIDAGVGVVMNDGKCYCRTLYTLKDKVVTYA